MPKVDRRRKPTLWVQTVKKLCKPGHSLVSQTKSTLLLFDVNMPNRFGSVRRVGTVSKDIGFEGNTVEDQFPAIASLFEMSTVRASRQELPRSNPRPPIETKPPPPGLYPRTMAPLRMMRSFLERCNTFHPDRNMLGSCVSNKHEAHLIRCFKESLSNIEDERSTPLFGRRD
jgi:hypothetical protein